MQEFFLNAAESSIWFSFSVFQTCALQSREADQVPSSNPDSPHESFDGCSFDSDGKLLVYNQTHPYKEKFCLTDWSRRDNVKIQIEPLQEEGLYLEY